FDFERLFGEDQNYHDQASDGGVIEYTTDAGVIWKDVRNIGTSPPYNLVLDLYDSRSGPENQNPLQGRLGFGNKNPSYPDADTVTLDFGTNLANQTFQIRLRIGSNNNGKGGERWSIDNAAVAGLERTPC